MLNNVKGVNIYMKKIRLELEKNIRYFTQLYNTNKKVKNYVVDFMKNHNIPSGKTIGIFNKSPSIILEDKNIVPDSELFLFTKALYEATNESKLNPKNWFNEEEIKNYEGYKAQIQGKQDIIIFEDVKQIGDYQYICPYISLQELAKLFEQGLITYNIRTQRDPTRIKFNDKIIETATIKERPVKEIEGKMLQGKFTQNMISLNIRKTGNENFEYNAKTRELAVMVDGKTTFTDIVDGMHRSAAGMRAVKQKPDIKLGFVVNILNYTEEEAQAFIEQEDHRTPISRTLIASYKNDDTNILITKEIDKYGTELTNELFNRFARDYKEIRLYDKYVTYETFAKALEYNFEYKSAREARRTKDFIINYFNELIGILKDKGYDSDSIAFDNTMFIGYIALASKLKDETNWEYKLEEAINNLDFRESNKNWGEMGIIKGIYPKINQSLVRKISQYF